MDRSESPLADTSPARGRWAVRHVPPTSRSIVELLRAGTLDAELAAMLWVLIEGRVPVIVAAQDRLVGKSTLLGALLDFLPPGIRHSIQNTGLGDLTFIVVTTPVSDE